MYSQSVNFGTLSAYTKRFGSVATLKFLVSDWMRRDIEVFPVANGVRARFISNLDRFAFLHLAESWPKLETMARIVATVEQPIVFDVGANIGAFSYLCHAHCSAVELHAFEPSRMCQPYLSANIGAFAKIYPVACGDISGTNEFFEIPSALQASTFVLDPVSHVSQNRFFVPTVRLSDFVDKLDRSGRPLIIKIDVQGFEAEVIEGLGAHLQQVDALLLESSWLSLKSIQAAIQLADDGWDIQVVSRLSGGADLLLRNPRSRFSFPNSLP
jgi:FkbM family methyltransferase